MKWTLEMSCAGATIHMRRARKGWEWRIETEGYLVNDNVGGVLPASKKQALTEAHRECLSQIGKWFDAMVAMRSVVKHFAPKPPSW